MSVGIQQTKTQIDGTSGNLVRDFENALIPLTRFASWLDATPDASLTALGYTSGEVAILKSAYADFEQLIAIYQGTQNLLLAKDFRTFGHQLWGAGL